MEIILVYLPPTRSNLLLQSVVLILSRNGLQNYFNQRGYMFPYLRATYLKCTQEQIRAHCGIKIRVIRIRKIPSSNLDPDFGRPDPEFSMFFSSYRVGYLRSA
jgi:hypothetical protein